ncbi:MAG: hypothetical protein Q8Q52_07565 [Acidimicrobiia bacterium]|nr:hypothetical protein [Acidimicrobiia bacterium]
MWLIVRRPFRHALRDVLMPEVALAWGGDEWEDRCLLLLRVRYRPPSPHHFQHVPADDQGDHGVEGFSSDGHLYQCYAPNPQLKIKDRFEDQRDKLTEDVGKLIANADGIAALLGPLKIKKYFFMVPVHDSKRVNASSGAEAGAVADVSQHLALVLTQAVCRWIVGSMQRRPQPPVLALDMHR